MRKNILLFLFVYEEIQSNYNVYYSIFSLKISNMEKEKKISLFCLECFRMYHALSCRVSNYWMPAQYGQQEHVVATVFTIPGHGG